jgi:Carbohydrate binding domain
MCTNRTAPHIVHLALALTIVAALICTGAQAEAPLWQNLVANGGAEKDLDNWKTMPGVATQDAHSGAKSFKITQTKTMQTDKLIPVDAMGKYKLSAWFRRVGKQPATLKFGLIPFDANYKQIQSEQVWVLPKTETELAQACTATDTVLKIKSAKGWLAGATRFVAFDVDETGKFLDLPNKNLSAKGISKIVKAGDLWEVHLAKPCGQTYAAGTKIREHKLGAKFLYCAASADKIPGEWTQFGAELQGMQRNSNGHFWPGTKYVKVMIFVALSGARQEGDAVLIDDISFGPKKGKPIATPRKTGSIAPTTLGIASMETPVDVAIPASLTNKDGRPYTIYVEAMPGKNWDEKISNALKRAFTGWSGAEIILPGKRIEITQPIKLWRRRKIAKRGIDTMADGVKLAYLPNCYAAIKGGTPADLPRGITLRGTSMGATTLIWKGDADQVMIDMPAPWYCKISDMTLDGSNVERVIGIRYRAGWEFERNGGKQNSFENIFLTRLDVGMHIGGPFLPDLVDARFNMIRVAGVRIGFRVVGANVAEMWFSEISIGGFEEAGFKLTGYSARLIRSIKEKDTPTKEIVLKDQDGREIFLEQLQHMKALNAQQIKTKGHSDVPGSLKRKWVGGGGPSCTIRNVEAHSHDPRGWLIDAYHAPVRLEHVRLEGASPFLRAGPQGSRNTRFNDIMIDINAVSFGGVTGRVVEYNRNNTLIIIGGTFEGLVGLGQNSSCQLIGTSFVRRPGATRRAKVPADAKIPENCTFYKETGKTLKIPYRGWAGKYWQSGEQPKPRIVQMKGTSGAKIFQMPESKPPAE